MLLSPNQLKEQGQVLTKTPLPKPIRPARTRLQQCPGDARLEGICSTQPWCVLGPTSYQAGDSAADVG